ncbi:hypothetical protein ACQ4PT_004268 [Festuca glaucescens]
MSTRSRGCGQQQSPGSQSAGAPSERSKKGKRTKPDSAGQDRAERETKKSNLSRREEEEDDDSCSSAVSSPLREPYMPAVEVERYPDGTQIRRPVDREISSAYNHTKAIYYEKIERQMKLPTLIPDTPPNCLDNDPTLLHIRESAKKIVLRAAQFIVGLSSSFDGEPLAWCSGFWIDLDSEKRTGTVVTTAHLIRTKRPSLDAWLCKDEFASDVKVTVHLRCGTIAKGCLLYHQKHYNLAFFRVKMDSSIQLPSFSDELKCAQDIFELGRDESVNLVINHGKVEYSNPTRRIPRPHLGLKFNAISLLNPVQVEKILIEYKIDEGLIVHEVSSGSPAEKCGIRVGDVIECLNGKCISTVVELEDMLLSIMENSGDGLKPDLDVEIQVYFVRRHLRRIKTLRVNVSDDGEIIVRGIHIFSGKPY